MLGPGLVSILHRDRMDLEFEKRQYLLTAITATIPERFYFRYRIASLSHLSEEIKQKPKTIKENNRTSKQAPSVGRSLLEEGLLLWEKKHVVLMIYRTPLLFGEGTSSCTDAYGPQTHRHLAPLPARMISTTRGRAAHTRSRRCRRRRHRCHASSTAVGY